MTLTKTRQALVIVHPRAFRHSLASKLLRHLESEFEVRIEESRYAGQTSEICRDLLVDFEGAVITAGGDGTFHEAVNAWADLGFPSGPRFAPLPLGTGNDFLYSVDARLREASAFLQHPLTRAAEADLGRVTFQTPDGPRSRFFCVGATAGFSALVTYRRSLLAARIPGNLSYLLALFISLSSWKNTSCRLESPGFRSDDAVFFNVNCANVRHYGGGMISAPRADAFAGRLDGVSMNLTLAEVFKALPQNFRGTFDAVPNVRQFAINDPLIITTGRACPVQADGELLGETPMTVECLPGRLPILLPEF